MKTHLTLLFFLAFSYIASAQVVPNQPEFITYKDVIIGLEEIAKQNLEPSDVLKKEFLELQQSYNLSNDENNYKDFVRVRLAFEMTRDSGLWQIRWAITDKEPNSDSIWSQWNRLGEPQYLTDDTLKPTAVAECDELSALFAFIARGLGVKKVGLYWPTWNHTVAVWTAKGINGEPVRIVLPTTQIFVSENATLGTMEFDRDKQKIIYDYERKDISLNYKIPFSVATMMLNQAKQYGAEPASVLQERRNRVSKIFGGS